MKIGCLKNLFRRRPKIIKTISVDPLQLSDEVLKQLEKDQKKMRSNPIVHGMTKRRRSFGKITSLPITKRHREGRSWLLDDKEK